MIGIKIPSIVRITLLLNITEKEKISQHGEFHRGQQRASPSGEVKGEIGDSALVCVP